MLIYFSINLLKLNKFDLGQNKTDLQFGTEQAFAILSSNQGLSLFVCSICIILLLPSVSSVPLS